MQNTANLDEPLPLNSFVIHRKFKAFFSDNLKPLRPGFLKVLASLRMSGMKVSHKTEKLFIHIEFF